MINEIEVISMMTAVKWSDFNKNLLWDEGIFEFLFADEPRVKVILYKSGKMLIYGDINSYPILERKISNEIGGMRVGEFVIVNQVLRGNLGSRVNLEEVSRILLFPDYEPEQFPGLIVQGEENITMLIFSTGKVIITGLKGDWRRKPEIVNQAIDWSNEIRPALSISENNIF